jgi:hypothetical protein
MDDFDGDEEEKCKPCNSYHVYDQCQFDEGAFDESGNLVLGGKT